MEWRAATPHWKEEFTRRSHFCNLICCRFYFSYSHVYVSRKVIVPCLYNLLRTSSLCSKFFNKTKADDTNILISQIAILRYRLIELKIDQVSFYYIPSFFHRLSIETFDRKFFYPWFSPLQQPSAWSFPFFIPYSICYLPYIHNSFSSFLPKQKSEIEALARSISQSKCACRVPAHLVRTIVGILQSPQCVIPLVFFFFAREDS